MALVSSVLVAGLNSGTSSGIDTTGSSLIVIHISFLASVNPTISDSKSNTWTGLTVASTTISNASRLYYCAGPTVGSGHTFSFNGTGSATCLTVQAHSGVRISPSPFDTENQDVGGVAANGANPGPITTTVVNELVITGFSWGASGAAVIDSPYTITDQADIIGGTNFGGAFAYSIQPTITSTDPFWRNGATGRCACNYSQFYYKLCSL